MKTRGSLLDPADSNNALNDPENDWGSFSETTTDPLRRAFRKTTSRTTQPVLAKRPPKRPRPRFGKRGSRRFRGRFGTNPKTTPENDLGAVFENTRGRFGRVVSTKRPRGSFQNDPLAR